jgi:hypothetical protein
MHSPLRRCKPALASYKIPFGDPEWVQPRQQRGKGSILKPVHKRRTIA